MTTEAPMDADADDEEEWEYPGPEGSIEVPSEVPAGTEAPVQVSLPGAIA